MKKRYCPDCQCPSCQIKHQKSFFCLICENELLPYSEDDGGQKPISWMSCDKWCAQLYFDDPLNPQKISQYEYDQMINGTRYRVLGSSEDNTTSIIKKPIQQQGRETILTTTFQPIANQKELETLVARLFKMKAFL